MVKMQKLYATMSFIWEMELLGLIALEMKE